MRKFLIALIFLSIPAVTLAFKPATLFKGIDRVAVYTQEQADDLFSKDYKLETKNLGYSPTTGYSERLTQSVSSSAATIYVSSVLDRDNLALPLSATNKGYFTVEGGSSREEAIVCTGVSTSTVSLTGCTRGLLASGSSEAGGGTAYPHNAGSRIIMTNIAQFFSNYVDTSSAQTIAGLKTFTTIPQIPTSTPTLGGQVASKTYADSLSYNGAPDGSETIKGIWQGATQSEMSIGTNLGSTGAGLLLQNRYATSTPSATTTIPITNSSGKLSQSFWDLTQPFTFSNATTTISGTLGASTSTFSGAITNSSTATSTFAGDLFGGGFTHIFVATTTGAGTWTKPTGVKQIKVRLVGGGGNGGNGTGSSDTVTGGGGGGGYSEEILNISATTSVAYIVPVASSTASLSVSGSIQLQATGGSDGGSAVSNGSSGGTGGIGSLGELNLAGQGGGGGVFVSGTSLTSGTGGGSFLGGGGLGSWASGGQVQGFVGRVYGGGGSGCIADAGTCTGGAGAQGVVIIEW